MNLSSILFDWRAVTPLYTYAVTDLSSKFQGTASVIEPCSFLYSSMVRHKDGGYSEDKDGKTCPRDSGYDSLSNRLSILDRLLHTHPIWLQLSLSEEEAAEVLQAQPPGVRAKTRELRQVCCCLTKKHLGKLPESSFQLLGHMASSIDIKYNAGKLWSIRQSLGVDSFPGLSSSSQLWDCMAQQGARASKEGSGAPGQRSRPDLLSLLLDPWLSPMLFFHSELRNPVRFSHSSGNTTLERSVTRGLSSWAARLLLDFSVAFHVNQNLIVFQQLLPIRDHCFPLVRLLTVARHGSLYL